MYPWAYWIIAGIILIILEIFVPGFTIATFGAGAVITGILSVFIKGFFIQLLIFSVVSFIIFLWLRPLMLKLFYKKSEDLKTNVDALIGKSARVLEKIDNSGFMGRVKVGGENWKALSNTGDIINTDESVEIVRIDGVKLIVKKTEGED